MIVGLFIIGLQVLVFREILNVRYNGRFIDNMIYFNINMTFVVIKEKELIGFRSLNWYDQINNIDIYSYTAQVLLVEFIVLLVWKAIFVARGD